MPLTLVEVPQDSQPQAEMCAAAFFLRSGKLTLTRFSNCTDIQDKQRWGVLLKPSLQAIWFADNVQQDPATGKVDVTGIFDQIEVKSPARHFESAAYLFFALRDVHDKANLVLYYVDLSTNEVLLEQQIEVASENPLTTMDVVVRMPRIPVPHAGVYAWEVHWENELVGFSRITACVS